VLAGLVASMRQELAQARAELERARERIAEVEARLKQNSRNSSRPPSSGAVRARIAAIIVYLYIGQFLSKNRTAQTLAELFGIPLSSGTVAALTARAAGKLDGFLQQVREHITASPVAGFDETGFRVQGTLHWVHCARTGKYTLLMVHTRRGKEAIEAMGVLPSFAGVAVHDAWAPYDICTGTDHQLCCAHALRELQAVTDLAPRANGAGPPRPPKHSPRCKDWPPRRPSRAGTPWTRPR
jgi:transposase IS66 family protein/uncharacterized protein DUF6444